MRRRRADLESPLSDLLLESWIQVSFRTSLINSLKEGSSDVILDAIPVFGRIQGDSRERVVEVHVDRLRLGEEKKGERVELLVFREVANERSS